MARRDVAQDVEDHVFPGTTILPIPMDFYLRPIVYFQSSVFVITPSEDDHGDGAQIQRKF